MDEKKEKVEAEILENSKDLETVKEKTGAVALKDKERDKQNSNTEIKNEEPYKFKKTAKPKKSHKVAILAVIIVVILIMIVAFSTIFALINSRNNTILSGISIRNTLVEGLTEEEAIKILNEKVEYERTREIPLKINGEKFSITPEQIGVEYDVEKAVNQAYKIGREGNIFQNNFEILRTMMEEHTFDVEITYNEKLLKDVLESFNAKLPSAMADNTYCIEENELIITRGTAGIVIDAEAAKEIIIDMIKSGENREIELETEHKECPKIDIDKIYSEVKTEPQNASYKKDPFEIIPHKNGIDFDLEAARKMISEEKDEYVIKLKTIEPEILTNEIGEEAFPDLLSAFSTKYDETNRPRSKNLKIAMSKLNGVVVMPGEVFSYNKTLGKRTVEDGYEYANGFAGGKVVPMLAGGICQISSTLYDAVLYANLNIVERHNHAFQAQYVEPGKDATVVYGSLDFKFENTRKYPIMIKTKCGGGLAEIKIFGIKEEVEYEVEVITDVLNYTPYKVVYQDDSSLASGKEKVAQWGLKGCKSITYRIVKLNGQEVSKEVLSTDTYNALDKIIKRGPKAVQAPVEKPVTPPVKPPVQPEKPAEPVTPPVETPTEPETPVEPEKPTEPTNQTPSE